MDYSPQIHEAGLFVNTESVAYKERDAFHAWCSRGMGGSNTSIVSWWMADTAKVQYGPPALDRQAFTFWPGGGGMLDAGVAPSDGYYIVRSWNEWKKQDEMEKEVE